jgi:hypothetical protein
MHPELHAVFRDNLLGAPRCYPSSINHCRASHNILNHSKSLSTSLLLPEYLRLLDAHGGMFTVPAAVSCQAVQHVQVFTFAKTASTEHSTLVSDNKRIP